ncbi:adenylyl-sulfate kinase [Ferroacidibacillus organovorans]|uniref:Adenylyl-sulfate kinase n=1 Tax=Ferroacidibacillus organovorans TaxID=1765683 RepID=A0A162UAN4_9BACL|nr:adenylyl-sulfate kinase [Ferroacidibacillus organovorans]KYP81603.1 adenylyl-sulfate kinase [Ferroacidibacillus organovorans]OAG94950.1 adenylyl-sulfate kinase [Ferroacidibacillus organovorans]OPG14972.1 adenylyl-sulfate kinase [Ferroacidibacillus organovorans]
MDHTSNLTEVKLTVTKEDFHKQNGHRSTAIWLTGLSGAGKSTIATALETELFRRGIHTYLLDGDNVRLGLNRDLGFSEEDRRENIRRVAEVSKLFVEAGTVVIVAFISPYRNDRDEARARFEEGEFLEVFVDCPIDVCEERDPKGLYKKAKAGTIPQFTGISSPYEPPLQPEFHLRTDLHSPEACVALLVEGLLERITPRA